MQQFPHSTGPGRRELQGERGLGTILSGGGIAPFAAKKSGNGMFGAVGGASAGAIGANIIGHVYKYVLFSYMVGSQPMLSSASV